MCRISHLVRPDVRFGHEKKILSTIIMQSMQSLPKLFDRATLLHKQSLTACTHTHTDVQSNFYFIFKIIIIKEHTFHIRNAQCSGLVTSLYTNNICIFFSQIYINSSFLLSMCIYSQNDEHMCELNIDERYNKTNKRIHCHPKRINTFYYILMLCAHM